MVQTLDFIHRFAIGFSPAWRLDFTHIFPLVREIFHTLVEKMHPFLLTEKRI